MTARLGLLSDEIVERWDMRRKCCPKGEQKRWEAAMLMGKEDGEKDEKGKEGCIGEDGSGEAVQGDGCYPELIEDRTIENVFTAFKHPEFRDSKTIYDPRSPEEHPKISCNNGPQRQIYYGISGSGNEV
ncbi:MAG: hypothetical protein M1813_003472 [Trichoglossum hirsutum]|nr:MAG: hypothetical protein M1813_003472 [Trichoglossum hirsutum]